MKLKCIIVEDEPLALEKLEEFVHQVPFLDLSASFLKSLDALNFIKNSQIDLIFLDIQMDRITGIELLESLKNPPRVIITTAFDKYALKGYELNVDDYLLKPFSFQRFLQAVNKVYDKFNEPPQQNGSGDFIFIKTENRIEKVELQEILFVEGQRDYLCIVTKTKRIMTLQTFRNLEAALPKTNFIRIHKSYMVAIDKIINIERNRIKIGSEILPISESYLDNFYTVLKQNKYLI